MGPVDVKTLMDCFPDIISSAKAAEADIVRLKSGTTGDTIVEFPLTPNLENPSIDLVDRIFTITGKIMNHYYAQVLFTGIEQENDRRVMIVEVPTRED